MMVRRSSWTTRERAKGLEPSTFSLGSGRRGCPFEAVRGGAGRCRAVAAGEGCPFRALLALGGVRLPGPSMQHLATERATTCESSRPAAGRTGGSRPCGTGGGGGGGGRRRGRRGAASAALRRSLCLMWLRGQLPPPLQCRSRKVDVPPVRPLP